MLKDGLFTTTLWPLATPVSSVCFIPQTLSTYCVPSAVLGVGIQQ